MNPFLKLLPCVLLAGAALAPLAIAQPAPADAGAGTAGGSVSPPDPAASASVVTSPTAWADKLATGGWTIVVQLLLSVFGGAYAVGSFIRFRRNAIAPKGLVEQADRLWNEGRFEELESLGDKRPSTLARIISFLAAERDSSVEDLTTTAGDIAARELGRHINRAYPLAIVATLEPLLGLLGTVLGMIESFDTVALAGSLGDASLLAGGISKALVTTAVGLVIAIPFLALHHHFRNKANEYTTLLEEDLGILIRHWFIKGRRAAETAAPVEKEA